MITSNDIIDYAQLKCINKSIFKIYHLRPPDNLCGNSLTLLNNQEEFEELFFKAPSEVIAIIPESLESKSRKFNQTFILSPNPSLSFTLIVNRFFREPINYSIGEWVHIKNKGSIASEVRIGNFSSITGNVDIGSGTELGDSVSINGIVKIGENVSIGPGSRIGHKGFNYPTDENGIPNEFPHVGKVYIGNNVRIGANCTIARGSLSDTVICDNVKLDDQVHVAHNVKIGSNTLITACVEISGSVSIGKNVWISPNSTIIDHVTIGDDCKIGIGSVVTKNVCSNKSVAGNPARVLRI